MDSQRIVLCLAALLLACSGSLQATEVAPGGAEGSFTFDHADVSLQYTYLIREPKGFYDEADPTWTLLFTASPTEPRDLDDFFLNPSLRIGLTLTAEFGEEPELQVYSQSIRVEDASLSGGEYPRIELARQDSDRFVGRIYQTETQNALDHAFFYDLRFNAPLVDPNAPIGDPLPSDGGDPGRAYRAWTTAIHSMDLDALRKLLPADMAAMLDDPDAAEELEFMALMTPRDVEITSGSTDGQTAVLHITGTLDGQAVSGEVVLTKHGESWIPTESSVQ